MYIRLPIFYNRCAIYAKEFYEYNIIYSKLFLNRIENQTIIPVNTPLPLTRVDRIGLASFYHFFRRKSRVVHPSDSRSGALPRE